MLAVSADQNTHILVNGRATDYGGRSFEWYPNWMVTKTSYRTKWLRKHLKLEG